MRAGWALLAPCILSCDLGVPEFGAAPWSMESTPSDGETDVARQSPLVVALDRRILPRSVTSSSVRLRSGSTVSAAAVSYDLLERTIEIAIPSSMPLVADTTYALEIDGLVDLDGATQPEPHLVYFTTGAELGEPAPEAARVDPFEVLALLRDRCGTAGCHVAPLPAAELDLASARGIDATIRRTSRQLELDSAGAMGAAGALWLAATRIVESSAGSGDPARSYLMYKVLGDDHIAGEIMPPRGRRLNATELELLSGWIASGARTSP